jgi:hypothetical protein
MIVVTLIKPSVIIWLTCRKSKSQSQTRCDRRSVGPSVLLSSRILGPRPDFCYCKTAAGLLCVAPSLTRGGVCRLRLLLALANAGIFAAVKISSTCRLYLEFYMSGFYMVWTPAIYNFTCNSSVYICMYNIYKAWYIRLCSCYNGCLVTAHLNNI